MLEGHGFWRLPAASKIARALEEYRLAWLEDMLLAHDIDAIAELQGIDVDADPRQRVPGHPATSTCRCSSGARRTS